MVEGQTEFKSDEKQRTDMIQVIKDTSENECIQDQITSLKTFIYPLLLELFPQKMITHGDPMCSLYRSKTFQKKHLDNPNNNGRVITCILYLNTDPCGGELKLHLDDVISIEPIFNRLLLFKSEELVHEVALNQNDRQAITLWLYDYWTLQEQQK